MASLFGNLQKRRRWCPACRRNVLAEETPFDSTTHAVLTVLTCGLWLPILVLAAIWHGIAHGGYYCPVCGKRCR